MIRLSPRLKAIADLVPQKGRIVDVGTDHGYLAIYLAEKNAPISVIATDVRPGPLSSARRHVIEAGLENTVELRLCDGLEAVLPEEADTIIIAGMGGETIQQILSRAPWSLTDRKLILGPQSKQEELRRWLYERGCGISEEHLVSDEGKIYPLICAGGKAEYEPTAAEYFIGRWPKKSRDALFYTYLSSCIAKLEREVVGLSKSNRMSDDARLFEMRELLYSLREMEEKSNE